ncbi:hypothetical protein PTKIN_Ptkin07bG0038700 [Pterospermum kingtungense]
MATISAFSTPPRLISKTHFKTPESLYFYPNSIHFQTKVCTFSFKNSTLSFKDKKQHRIWKLKSAEDEGAAVPEQEETATAEQQESVSVPVSPSDILKMYFQEADGISNVKVQVLEGIGTVELTKQTTVQATGVASNLVEIIQGAGFKLQTLNLSFDDEEEILV